MVHVPAGEFLMGSDKKTDRLAYRSEIPQRRVYLDAFEIGKYEVTALEYLGFVLATNRSRNWIGGMTAEISRRRWRIIPSCTCPGMTPMLSASGRGNGCRRKQNGRKQRAEWTGGSFPGVKNMRGRAGRISGEPAFRVRYGIVQNDYYCTHRLFRLISMRMP